MSPPNLVEFLQLRFKPALLPSPSSPPASLSSAIQPLLSTPGVDAVYIGQPLESAEYFLAVIRWASPAAHDAFVASPASTAWAASLRALLTRHPLTSRVVFSRGDADAVLGAPCTEICTAWGAEDRFLEDRMEPFALAIDQGKLSGYHAIAWGGFEQEVPDDNEVIAGPAVRLILGWDSKQAHMQYKGVGSVIDQNIDYIRSGRKQFEMIHVNLTKL